MDYKKSKAPVNTVTRNIMDLCDEAMSTIVILQRTTATTTLSKSQGHDSAQTDRLPVPCSRGNHLLSVHARRHLCAAGHGHRQHGV